MLVPRTDEKRLPVAGIPGQSPLCVPDMTHSIAAHWLAANRLVTPYVKSGAAAKARFTKLRSSSLPRATTPKVTSSNTQSSAKRARTLSGSLLSMDDQAIAHSSSIRSKSEVAMTHSFSLCQSCFCYPREQFLTPRPSWHGLGPLPNCCTSPSLVLVYAGSAMIE